VSSCNEREQNYFECLKEGTFDFRQELTFGKHVCACGMLFVPITEQGSHADSASALNKRRCAPAPVSHVRNCESARDVCATSASAEEREQKRLSLSNRSFWR